MTQPPTTQRFADRYLAVALASWLRARHAGQATSEDVAEQLHRATEIVLGPGHEHVVQQAGHAEPLPAYLQTATGPALLILAAPGDPAGAGGSAEFLSAAVNAGAAVACEQVSLVPTARAGRFVAWEAFPVPAPAIPIDHVGEAGVGLDSAIRAAATTLHQWQQATTDTNLITTLRIRTEHPAPPLPSSYSARARLVAEKAARTLAIVELAQQPPAGAATASDISTWWRSLADVERAARHAYRTAINSPLPASTI